MDAKVQKEFVLIVGTDEEGDTGKIENDLVAKAAELEKLGNEKLGVKIAINVKEDKETADKEEKPADTDDNDDKDEEKE